MHVISKVEEGVAAVQLDRRDLRALVALFDLVASESKHSMNTREVFRVYRLRKRALGFANLAKTGPSVDEGALQGQIDTVKLQAGENLVTISFHELRTWRAIFDDSSPQYEAYKEERMKQIVSGSGGDPIKDAEFDLVKKMLEEVLSAHRDSVTKFGTGPCGA